MARNGSGTYNLITNSWNPATNGVSATPTDWQNLINDVAAALTQSLSADGQTPMTGNLNAGNNKLTNLAAGSATGDSLRWEQLFSQGQPANLASAATTDIGAQNTVLLNITGTTTITSFGANYNGPRYLRFDGVLTLTHNATTLILPGGANITTAAGDSAIVVPNGTPANGWRVWYQRADGSILVDGSVTASKLADGSVTTAKLVDGSVTTTKLADGAAVGVKVGSKIQPISASLASNAINITLAPTTLDFRNTTLTNGAVTTLSNTSNATLTIASTDSFGFVTASGTQRLVILAHNNAGTIELSAAALTGGANFDETNLITTATTATTVTAIKAANVRTNVAYRVVGIIDAAFTTGTGWTAVSLVQGAGGQSGVGLINNLRAFVNFNGTGAVAIRRSFNVSSITDNGVGDYTINFTTALPDTNYVPLTGSGSNASALLAFIADDAAARTTTSVRIRTANSTFNSADSSFVHLSVFW